MEVARLIGPLIRFVMITAAREDEERRKALEGERLQQQYGGQGTDDADPYSTAHPECIRCDR
jgi:hypothetical protein